jgi:site-specific recombinase XerD
MEVKKNINPETSTFASTSSGKMSQESNARDSLEHVFDLAKSDLRSWATVYLECQVKRTKAPATYGQITYDLANFIGFFISTLDSFDVFKWTPQTTTQYIESLQELGRKPATIYRRFISIRTFGRWIYSQRPELFPLGDPARNVKTTYSRCNPAKFHLRKTDQTL